MLCRCPVRVLAASLIFGAACSGSIEPSSPGGASSKPSGTTPSEGKPGTKPGMPGTDDPAQPPDTSDTLPGLGEGPYAPDRSTAECKGIDPGPSPIRRLTRTEY